MELRLEDFNFLVKEGDVIRLLEFGEITREYKVISIEGDKVQLEKADEKNT